MRLGNRYGHRALRVNQCARQIGLVVLDKRLEFRRKQCKRNAEPKLAAFALGGFDSNFTAHALDQSFADGQSETLNTTKQQTITKNNTSSSVCVCQYVPIPPYTRALSASACANGSNR